MWYEPNITDNHHILRLQNAVFITSHHILQKQKEIFTFLFWKKHDNKTSQSSQEQKRTQRSLPTKPDMQG